LILIEGILIRHTKWTRTETCNCFYVIKSDWSHSMVVVLFTSGLQSELLESNLLSSLRFVVAILRPFTYIRE
jgi:hypothetical protein